MKKGTERLNIIYQYKKISGKIRNKKYKIKKTNLTVNKKR